VKKIIYAACIVALLYCTAAAIAWQWNNPKANTLTVIRYAPEVLRFEKLDAYQER